MQDKILGKKIKKGISSITDSGISLKNNKTKDVIKVIKSLDNREMLLIGNTAKNNNQEVGFLVCLRTLMTVGLPLMKNVLTPLAKSVLIPSGLSAWMSATDAAIQKKNYGSETTALTISNGEIKDIMEIVKPL